MILLRFFMVSGVTTRSVERFLILDCSTAPIHSPTACALQPNPRVVQALLNLDWRHSRSERPTWLRSELGEKIHPLIHDQ